MSEKVALLRRPRPPKAEQPAKALVKSRSIGIPNQTSSELQMVSSSFQDGILSPVPTLHSEYEPMARSTSRKLPKKRIIPYNSSDDQTIRSGDGRSGWSKKPLVLPYKPRGPDPFPSRLPRQPLEIKQEYLLADDSHYYKQPEFSLDDFLLTSKAIPASLRPSLTKAVLSRTNYRKLTRIFQEASQTSRPTISTVNMVQQYDNLPKAKNKKIPKTQVIVEMKKVVKERLADLGITSPSRMGIDDGKINDVLDEVHEIGGSIGLGEKSQMSLFTKATVQFFEGSRKSESSEESDENVITPAELGILNCLMEGGYVLSLKAHFISEVPDLSPLHESLVYFNLSFNEIVEFPRDVLNCTNLHVLKFRDNPLKEIPSDISRLKNLRTLILSFCCLTNLPIAIFSITTLEFLDVSYNLLSFIPNDIKNLDNLRFLNIEGNEIKGLPCGLLKINLFRIRIRNNYMSPLFWRENSTNTPQRLSDLCCLTIQKKFIQRRRMSYSQFPTSIALQLTSYTRCDCCRGPLYGEGLRIIRPCTEIWGIRRIPFIFNSCSTSCYHDFIRNVDPKVADLIYGVASDEGRRVQSA